MSCKLNQYGGYKLEDVAQEIASLYGAELENWETKNNTLFVYCNEYGEEFVSELPFNQIKSFMEM